VSGAYRITPTAETHLEEIGEYTREEWGENQMSVYIRALFSRFQWLADNPKLGQSRPKLAPELRSYREGSHIVFYKPTPERIDIIAVLHQSMDFQTYFNELM
jgi:toxin ParE1/3/4